MLVLFRAVITTVTVLVTLYGTCYLTANRKVNKCYIIWKIV